MYTYVYMYVYVWRRVSASRTGPWGNTHYGQCSY